MAATKTPVSYLQEICMKYISAVPKYDLIECDHDKMFEYLVTASNFSANGVSSSKQNAKHMAAKNLLDQMKQLDRFKEILRNIPAVPGCEKNNNDVDSVSYLMAVCAKNRWDPPAFVVTGCAGLSNEPVFYMNCTFKSFQAEGRARTKRDAKKLAAKNMLEQIGDLLKGTESDEPMEVAPCHYTIDEVLTLYRKHHKWNRTSTESLVNRHFFFEKFSAEKKQAVKDLLRSVESCRNIVHDICKALNIRYQVIEVKPNFKVFELLAEGFDCVIVDQEPEIWNKVVDYFKIMMWAC